MDETSGRLDKIFNLNKKNGFHIVINENAEELESLTGESTFYTRARKCVPKRINKKKCMVVASIIAILGVLVFGSVFMIRFAAGRQAQQVQFDAELRNRIVSIESKLDELKSLIHELPLGEIPEMAKIEGSGFDQELPTDDAELLAPSTRAVDEFTKTIVGKWKQIRHEDMEEYLIAEGKSWMFRRMALSVSPNLEIAATENNRYKQIFTAPMYKGVFPLWLDGETANYKDVDDVDVIGSSVEIDNYLQNICTGGNNGKIITTYKLNGDELYLTTMLADKGGIVASRVFVRDN